MHAFYIFGTCMRMALSFKIGKEVGRVSTSIAKKWEAFEKLFYFLSEVW